MGTDSRHIQFDVMEIPVSRIKRHKILIRQLPNEFESLARSIQRNGLLHPVVVRRADEFFEIVSGGRRYSACKYLGFQTISCRVIDIDEKGAFEISLVENLQRNRLNPIDEATAFKIYVEEFGWGGVTDIAEQIGKSPSYVTKKMKLLELPDDILEAIRNSTLSESIAEELGSISDVSEQSRLAQLIAKRHLSFREARSLIKKQADVETVSTSHKLSESEKGQHILEKAIESSRMHLDAVSSLFDETDNWIIRETLMQHRNMVHSQLDLLLKQKKKIHQLTLENR